MKTFDFKTLKDNTFCIYDVKEGQADKIKIIMEELGIEEYESSALPIYYFINKNQDSSMYICSDYSYFQCFENNTFSHTYRKTATEFLEKYREWQRKHLLDDVPYFNPQPHYKQYIGKKYAVHCKTQEEWDRVNEILYKIPDYDWTNYGIEATLNCDRKGCCNKSRYTEEGYTILSVEQFFGEEKEKAITATEARIIAEDEFAITAKILNDYYTYPLRSYGKPLPKADKYWSPGEVRTKINLDDFEEIRKIISGEPIKIKRKYYNKPTKLKKLMTNIVDHAKFALLSQDEKDLRNAGLKDSEGNWTNQALLIVEVKKAVDLGYKDDDDMLSKIAISNDSIQYSQMEYHNMLIEYGEDLIKAAKAYNKDQKKK